MKVCQFKELSEKGARKGGGNASKQGISAQIADFVTGTGPVTKQQWLSRFNGVVTRYLRNYLSWRQVKRRSIRTILDANSANKNAGLSMKTGRRSAHRARLSS